MTTPRRRVARLSVPAAAGLLAAALAAAPAASAASTASPSAIAATPSCSAVAHHQDAAHTGVGCALPTGALTARWSRDLGEPVSYPLVVGSQVFVTTPVAGGGYGTELWSLSASTGAVTWGPVPLGGTYDWSALAYDGGHVYTVTFDGTVSAFAAATGRQLWATRTSYFAGEPVATGGAVFLQTSGPVWALSGSTGVTTWSTGFDGTGSSVAVANGGVYVAGGLTLGRLATTNGAVVWKDNAGGDGGGGGTTFVAGGRVWDTLFDQVHRTDTGKLVGTFAGTPAFANGDVYLVSGSTVYVQDAKTRVPIRSFTLPAAAVTSPVLSGGSLFVGTADQKVYRVDLTSGATTWSAGLPAVAGGGAEYGSPISDIAVGSGRLVVPAGTTITAFG